MKTHAESRSWFLSKARSPCWIVLPGISKFKNRLENLFSKTVPLKNTFNGNFIFYSNFCCQCLRAQPCTTEHYWCALNPVLDQSLSVTAFLSAGDFVRNKLFAEPAQMCPYGKLFCFLFARTVFRKSTLLDLLQE